MKIDKFVVVTLKYRYIADIIRNMINLGRVRKIKQGNNRGPTVYWMSREQRVSDNWSLLYAQELAQEQQQPLLVFFYLHPIGSYNPQHYLWMLKGLEELARELKQLNIPFIVTTENPKKALIKLFKDTHAANLVYDMSPLSGARKRTTAVAVKLNASIYEVDSRNIVPVWEVLDKQAYAASSIRARLVPLLKKYYTDYPQVIVSSIKHNHDYPDFDKIRKELQLDNFKQNPYYPTSGSKAANKALAHFLDNKASRYSQDKNNPLLSATSKLSAYLHFGQLSSLRVLLEFAQKFPKIDILDKKSYSQSFLDEVVIRKELAENYCYYNSRYKSIKGGPIWAQNELKIHEQDTRDYNYSYEEFARARTHDELWNACQTQLVNTGFIPGYLRMYWAKKFLEWSKTPTLALEYTIKLNDYYSLDGREPNGYAGIQWAITGLHDHPWQNRKVFGKVRYMSEQACIKKFDINAYITSVKQKQLQE